MHHHHFCAAGINDAACWTCALKREKEDEQLTCSIKSGCSGSAYVCKRTHQWACLYVNGLGETKRRSRAESKADWLIVSWAESQQRFSVKKTALLRRALQQQLLCSTLKFLMKKMLDSTHSTFRNLVILDDFKKIWRWCLTCWMYTNDIDDSNEIVLMVDNMTCVDDNDNCHCHCHMDLEQGCTRRCEWAKDPFHSSHSPIHVNNPCNSETGSVVRCDWECIQSASLGAKHRERWQLSRSLHLGTKNTRSSFSKTSQAKKDDWNE